MEQLRCGITALCILGALCSAVTANGKRLPTLQDLQIGTPGGSLSISRDERWLALESDGQLAILSYPRGKAVEQLGQGWLARWSPLEDRLAFYSIRSGHPQLWVWDGASGAKQVTSFGKGVDPDFTTRFAGSADAAMQYSWSPDGRRLVFASRVPSPRHVDPGSPLVLTNSTPPDLTTSGLCGKLPTFCPTVPRLRIREVLFEPARFDVDLVSQLFIADAQTGVTVQLTHGRLDVFNPVWTRDGLAILAASVPSPGGSAGMLAGLLRAGDTSRGQILKIRPEDGTAMTLVETKGTARSLQLSRMGDSLAFLDSDSPLASPHVKIIDLQGKRSPLTVWDRSVDEFQWTKDEKLLIAYRDKGRSFVAQVSRSHPEPPRIRSLDSSEFPLAWAQDKNGAIVWLDSLGTLRRRSTATEGPSVLYRFRSANLLLGRAEELTWKNKRGDILRGFLLYPPNHDPKRRYPLIVDAYPLATLGQWMHSMGANHVWAATGYVIFMPGERAPHVWMNADDPAFGAAAQGPAGFEVGLDDLLSGIDELVNRDVVDPDRMCLYGHSNGGGAASYFVTLTDRFKCAVIAAPGSVNWTDWPVLQTEGRRVVTEFSGGLDFDRDIGQYVKMSAVFNLYKSRTPMLIACGENDPALVGAIGVYNAVRATGTEVTMVRYPGQGHVLTGAAMEDFWQRQMAFFRSYLSESRAVAALKPQPRD